MDLTTYLPFYWTVIANGWTAASSRTYLRKFGLGVVEWRVLATLLTRESATALDVARLTGMDLAAASRAMQALARKSLVEPISGRFPGRTKPFGMTAAGRVMALRVEESAKQRAEALLGDLSTDERATLLDLLRRVHARLPDLKDE